MLNPQFLQVDPIVADAFGPLHNKDVLDFGTGAGYSAMMLSKLGANVTTVEIQQKIAATRELLEHNVRAEVIQDVRKGNLLPFNKEQFDAAFARCVLREAKSFEDMLIIQKEIYRVLKKGGIYLLREGTQKGLSGFDRQDFLNSLLKAGFRIEVDKIIDARDVDPDEYNDVPGDYLIKAVK